MRSFAGDAIEQRFIGGEASMVRTPRGSACLLSATLDIAASDYFDPSARRRVPFEEIQRSVATSLQAIIEADGAARMRVQFKYSLAPDHRAMLHLPDRSISLDRWREPAGDSVLIDEPEVVRAIRDAMRSGAPVRMAARSRDTGRIVVDRLPPTDFAPLDFCRSLLPALSHDEAPDLTNALSVEFVAERDEAFEITPQDARICARTEDGATLYRGALQRTTGFFSQTSKVFVSFDEAGAVASVYIPGIFEARAADGGFAADLSIAANSNDPLGPAETSGCLGAAPVEICAYPSEDAAPGVTHFGPCFGALAMGDLLDDPTLLTGDVAEPGAGALARAAIAFAPARSVAGGFGGGLGGGFVGGFGGSFGGAGPISSVLSGASPQGSQEGGSGTGSASDVSAQGRENGGADGGASGGFAVIALPATFVLYASLLATGFASLRLSAWGARRPEA